MWVRLDGCKRELIFKKNLCNENKQNKALVL